MAEKKKKNSPEIYKLRPDSCSLTYGYYNLRRRRLPGAIDTKKSNIRDKFKRFESKIAQLLKEEIVKLSDIDVCFKGERNQKNLIELFEKLEINFKIEGLMERLYPIGGDAYKAELKETVEFIFEHLESLCKTLAVLEV